MFNNITITMNARMSPLFSSAMYNATFLHIKFFKNHHHHMFKKHNFIKFVLPIIACEKVSVQFIKRLKK